MTLTDIENLLGVTFSKRHRVALLDKCDPIHEWCDFLVPASPHEMLQLAAVNEALHKQDRWNAWPDFLVAFASNGCADYFAYDLRNAPPTILYIDPDLTVKENLAATIKLKYESFDDWYQSRLNRRSK